MDENMAATTSSAAQKTGLNDTSPSTKRSMEDQDIGQTAKKTKCDVVTNGNSVDEEIDKQPSCEIQFAGDTQTSLQNTPKEEKSTTWTKASHDARLLLENSNTWTQEDVTVDELFVGINNIADEEFLSQHCPLLDMSSEETRRTFEMPHLVDVTSQWKDNIFHNNIIPTIPNLTKPLTCIENNKFPLHDLFEWTKKTAKEKGIIETHQILNALTNQTQWIKSNQVSKVYGQVEYEKWIKSSCSQNIKTIKETDTDSVLMYIISGYVLAAHNGWHDGDTKNNLESELEGVKNQYNVTDTDIENKTDFELLIQLLEAYSQRNVDDITIAISKTLANELHKLSLNGSDLDQVSAIPSPKPAEFISSYRDIVWNLLGTIGNDKNKIIANDIKNGTYDKMSETKEHSISILSELQSLSKSEKQRIIKDYIQRFPNDDIIQSHKIVPHPSLKLQPLFDSLLEFQKKLMIDELYSEGVKDYIMRDLEEGNRLSSNCDIEKGAPMQRMVSYSIRNLEEQEPYIVSSPKPDIIKRKNRRGEIVSLDKTNSETMVEEMEEQTEQDILAAQAAQAEQATQPEQAMQPEQTEQSQYPEQTTQSQQLRQPEWVAQAEQEVYVKLEQQGIQVEQTAQLEQEQYEEQVEYVEQEVQDEDLYENKHA